MKMASDLQKRYYEQTAAQYDTMHLEKEKEHVLALHLLAAYIDFYNIRSVLDVGAGTGRAMTWIKEHFPSLIVKGVEPVEALRQQGYAKGVSREDLIDGGGYDLPFADNSFDLVCEFAVLHHVRRPNRVVEEMSRVASRMVCISDSNFLGQGPGFLRVIKFLIYGAGLWPAAIFLKTRGKGYTFSEGDGVAYSYSVYQSLTKLRRNWNTIRILTTGGDSDSRRSTMLSAAHLLLLAMDPKKEALK